MNITSQDLHQHLTGERTYAKEGELVKECLAELRRIGAFAWKQNQGAMIVPDKGKRRIVRYAHVDGISDIIGVLPSGRFIAVECKRKGNKPTPDQAWFLERVREAGGLGIVAHTPGEMLAQIAKVEGGEA